MPQVKYYRLSHSPTHFHFPKSWQLDLARWSSMYMNAEAGVPGQFHVHMTAWRQHVADTFTLTFPEVDDAVTYRIYRSNGWDYDVWRSEERDKRLKYNRRKKQRRARTGRRT